jgi:hypothetical protein
VRPSRGAWLVGAAVALLVLAPHPAGADAAKPGSFRSEVTSVEPTVGGVSIEVAGGDSFLELTVDPGIEVEVPGYQDEPYLRVLADGTVEENELSPTAFVNRDRFGTEAPAQADVDAEPRWVEVADGGTFAWHDHRIHRMSDAQETSFDWDLPLVIDGQEVQVSGRLAEAGGVSPLPTIAVLLVVGIGGWFVGRRRVTVAVPVMTLVGGGVATFVGWRAVASQPEAAGASPLPFVLGAVALGLALVGAGLALRRRAVAADLCGLASSAALGGWVLLRFSVLTNPVLPTDLPANVDRLGTAVVLALALSSAVLGVQGGALAGGERAGGEVSPAPAPG